jgi:large subunit ribosomal protein L14e
MINVGRIVVKLAGRDAGKKAVIVNVTDNYVLLDGQTRRRKCNIAHIEPTSQTIELEKNASHDVVSKAFEKLGLSVRNTTAKETKKRLKKTRKIKKKKVTTKNNDTKKAKENKKKTN